MRSQVRIPSQTSVIFYLFDVPNFFQNCIKMCICSSYDHFGHLLPPHVRSTGPLPSSFSLEWRIGCVMGPTCAAVEPVEEVVGLALPGGAQGVGRVLPPVQRPLSSSGQSAAARVRDRDGRAPVARAVQRAEPSPAGSLELLSSLRIFSFPFSSALQISEEETLSKKVNLPSFSSSPL